MNEHPAVAKLTAAYWPVLLAAIAAAGAGGYLLSTNAAAADSIFNPLLHAIGVYFIARGVFMGWSGARMAESAAAAVRTATCRYCKEPIHEDAVVCPHCRHALRLTGETPPDADQE